MRPRGSRIIEFYAPALLFYQLASSWKVTKAGCQKQDLERLSYMKTSVEKSKEEL